MQSMGLCGLQASPLRTRRLNRRDWILLRQNSISGILVWQQIHLAAETIVPQRQHSTSGGSFK